MYDEKAGLTVGAQDLYPIQGTTGSQFLPSMRSQFPGLDTSFDNPENSVASQIQPNIVDDMSNYATLVVDTQN